MQVGDAAVRVDHREAGPLGVALGEGGLDGGLLGVRQGGDLVGEGADAVVGVEARLKSRRRTLQNYTAQHSRRTSRLETRSVRLRVTCSL